MNVQLERIGFAVLFALATAALTLTSVQASYCDNAGCRLNAAVSATSTGSADELPTAWIDLDEGAQ